MRRATCSPAPAFAGHRACIPCSMHRCELRACARGGRTFSLRAQGAGSRRRIRIHVYISSACAGSSCTPTAAKRSPPAASVRSTSASSDMHPPPPPPPASHPPFARARAHRRFRLGCAQCRSIRREYSHGARRPVGWAAPTRRRGEPLPWLHGSTDLPQHSYSHRREGGVAAVGGPVPDTSVLIGLGPALRWNTGVHVATQNATMQRRAPRCNGTRGCTAAGAGGADGIGPDPRDLLGAFRLRNLRRGARCVRAPITGTPSTRNRDYHYP